MLSSPNQNTERIKPPEGAARSPFWERLDTVLVIEEARVAEQRRWVDQDDTQTHLEDPYAGLESRVGHLMMMGKMDAEQALRVLEEDAGGC